MLSSIWRTALAAVVLSVFAPAARAAPCISDAELEAAVGAEVRSGAFTVSTAKLGDRSMCSGLTVAQAIQRLRAGTQPSRPAPVAEAPQAAAPSARAGAQANAAGTASVLRHVGKHSFVKVGGHGFRQNPTIVAGLTRAGVSPALRRELEGYQVASLITREDGLVIDQGCVAHNCGDEHYAIYYDTASGATTLCVYAAYPAPSGSRWYAAGNGGRPVTSPEKCSDGGYGAPVALRGGDGGGPVETERGPPAVADITAALRFERPGLCSSQALQKINGQAHDRGWASIGAIRRVDFARGREDDWHVLRANLSARWNGLTITQIEFFFEPESDVNLYSITFREPLAQAGATLRRLGFPMSSGERTIPTDGMEVVMSILAEDGGGTVLNCS